jgi:hypothetical protein
MFMPPRRIELRTHGFSVYPFLMEHNDLALNIGRNIKQAGQSVTKNVKRFASHAVNM